MTATFIATRPRLRDDDGLESDAPEWPSPWDRALILNHPGVPLPNGQSMFSCLTSQDVLQGLLLDVNVCESIVVGGWPQLIRQRPSVARFVVDVDVEDLALNGDGFETRVRLSEVHPAMRVLAYHPSPVMGHESWDRIDDDLIPMLAEQVPQPPADGEAADDPALEHSHFFYFSNFGVDLDGGSCLELPNGARWWTSAGFPSAATQHGIFASYPARHVEQRSLSGVLTIPQPADARHVAEHFFEAYNLARRLRTILNMLYGMPAHIIAYSTDRRIGRGALGNRQVLTGIQYRHRPDPFWCRRKTVNAQEFNAAARTTLSEGGSNLIQAVQRAVDAFDTAREAFSLPVSTILACAAVEALLRPPEDEGWLAHVRSAAIGVWPGRRAEYTAKRVQELFKLRHKIVHGFNLPPYLDLVRVRDFGEDLAARLVQSALASMTANDRTTRDAWRIGLEEAASVSG